MAPVSGKALMRPASAGAIRSRPQCQQIQATRYNRLFVGGHLCISPVDAAEHKRTKARSPQRLAEVDSQQHMTAVPIGLVIVRRPLDQLPAAHEEAGRKSILTRPASAPCVRPSLHPILEVGATVAVSHPPLAKPDSRPASRPASRLASRPTSAKPAAAPQNQSELVSDSVLNVLAGELPCGSRPVSTESLLLLAGLLPKGEGSTGSRAACGAQPTQPEQLKRPVSAPCGRAPRDERDMRRLLKQAIPEKVPPKPMRLAGNGAMGPKPTGLPRPDDACRKARSRSAGARRPRPRQPKPFESTYQRDF